MNNMKITGMLKHYQYLWKNRDNIMPEINVKIKKKSIIVHEYILIEYFNIYKNNGTNEFDLYKAITFNISDEYFELIIKYLYGFYYDFKNISLNDLFKIHVFLTEYCTCSILIYKIENKIHRILYYLPNIWIMYDGKSTGKNKFYNYEMAFDIKNLSKHSVIKKFRKNVSEYKHYYLNKISRPEINVKLAHHKIKNLDDLFDKYKEYLLDDEIYDYALSLVFKKYDLNNPEHGFYIPDPKTRSVDISDDDDGVEMMRKLYFYNLMKHKYYTLSFLNKNFEKINMANIFNGCYKRYKYSKNLYTIHVILKCAKLEEKNDKTK